MLVFLVFISMLVVTVYFEFISPENLEETLLEQHPHIASSSNRYSTFLRIEIHTAI